MSRLKMTRLKMTKSSGNVFLDLGFDPAEADLLRLRSGLMVELGEYLKGTGRPQADIARQLGISQARVSKLIRGRFEEFRLDMLVTLAVRAGLHVEMKVAA
jgi:predicted XRE-type DNA-binding protein